MVSRVQVFKMLIDSRLLLDQDFKKKILNNSYIVVNSLIYWPFNWAENILQYLNN